MAVDISLTYLTQILTTNFRKSEPNDAKNSSRRGSKGKAAATNSLIDNDTQRIILDLLSDYSTNGGAGRLVMEQLADTLSQLHSAFHRNDFISTASAILAKHSAFFSPKPEHLACIIDAQVALHNPPLVCRFSSFMTLYLFMPIQVLFLKPLRSLSMDPTPLRKGIHITFLRIRTL